MPTPPVVEVPAVVVSSGLELQGISAAQFNNPTQTAAFATAIEGTLTIDAVVQNVVATDISLPLRRKLLQSGVDVSYDVLVDVPDVGTCGACYCISIRSF